MSTGEEAYLILVIAAFSTFALALVYGSWQQARVDREKRGPKSRNANASSVNPADSAIKRASGFSKWRETKDAITPAVGKQDFEG